MIDLKQKELAEGQNRNFPRSRYEEMTKDQLIDMILAMQFTLGMAKEVGEICHHILKGVQAIRGGVGGFFNINEIADGVARSSIFGQLLLSQFGVDSEREIKKVTENVLKRDWLNNPSGKNIEYCQCLENNLDIDNFIVNYYDIERELYICIECNKPLIHHQKE